MFEFLRSLVQIVAPIFVVSTMLNVGLTQTLSNITVNHSELFAPIIEPTLSTGTQALVVAALTYLAK